MRDIHAASLAAAAAASALRVARYARSTSLL